jgi:Transposase DDE domain
MPSTSLVLAADAADRRRQIPKMAFKVEAWPEYEAGLRRRGSLTLWIDDAALDHWQTFGPGGQARYKDAAIQTMPLVRTAFRLALRQTEGLMASVITLMDLTISAPDLHDQPPGRDVTGDPTRFTATRSVAFIDR